MNPEEAKKLTEDIFDIIERKNIDDVKSIENIILNDYKKNYVNKEIFPRIPFTISLEEIVNIDLNDDYTLKEKLTIKDPLAKLLYALAWKNGDLKKIKHIIKGIKEVDKNNEKPTDALVFYNYGKYLAKPEEHPIIDQHVIRAFLTFKAESHKEIEDARRLNDSQKIKKEYVDNYKNWLTKLGKSFDDVEERKNFYYQVDRQLFALGKTIKTK